MCHRWFTRGQRPPGLCDQRYTWAHLFAAVRPATGQSFALVLPELSTEAMQVFLDMFAATLAADEHAALVADQAGWHIAEALRVPDNVTLVYLPSYSPELTWGKSSQGNSGHGVMTLCSCDFVRSAVRAIRCDAARCRARSNSHTARIKTGAAPISRLQRARLQAGETILNLGW